jgi:hypothetical protein
MKAKISKILYWIADKVMRLADWFAGVKTVSYEFTPKGTLYAGAASAVPPVGGTVHIENREHAGDWKCESVKPAAFGISMEIRKYDL